MATSATAARTFVDFVPRHRLQEGPGEVALRVDLSGEGFRKDQIKVLIDNYGKLRIRGERPLGAAGGIDQWRRFSTDFQVPGSCDAASIRARLDKDGVLLITMPMLSAPAATAGGDEEPAPAAAGTNAGGGGAAGQDHEPGQAASAQQAAVTAAAEAEEDKGQEEDDAGARAPMAMGRPGQDDEQRLGSDKDRRRRRMLAIFAVVLALVAAGVFARYRLIDPSADTSPSAGNHIVSLSDQFV